MTKPDEGWAARLLDVAGERELQLARGHVPDLDGPVGGAGAEPLVAGIEGQRAHPPAPSN